MEFSAKFKRYFAIVTLVLAFVHFVLEAAYTVIVGQHFLGYLPDCVGVILLVAGACLLIKNKHSTGVLCGAWGFTFCLHYRTWAWRFEDFTAGTLNEAQTGIMYLLASTMIISLTCFSITMMMNIRPSGRYMN
ncbi:MAG: hypothetical protein ACJZ66_00075 [Parvibaculales bacterium]